MKQTTKVILLSLLVFPGIGHLVLKKYAIAIGFIASFAYLLLGLVKDIHDKTQQVIESMIRGEIPMQVSAIRQALIDHGALDNPNLTTIGYILLIIWVLAAFDAYRISNNSSNNITEQSS
ncbi:hypothetical protein ESZ36_00645 [Colwellia demingiae]|uniref:DUF5683 domain-containing protein n=1 Tax=Colwellia demingiae TaxID=89401 RepID=A0A5C6QSI5_9GAMM|nr:hypothetical protein [Colwellia demingiae]TWX71777.1 hypothetical protein ESZ36_00645 [Colwellia demingiae]